MVHPVQSQAKLIETAPPLLRDFNSAKEPTSIAKECAWHRLEPAGHAAPIPARTIASRWTDLRTHEREATVKTGSDHHTLSLALQGSNLALETEGRRVHDGSVRLGMVQISSPGVMMHATFRAPCDFLHLRIANRRLAERHREMRHFAWSGELPLANSGFSRDAVIEQLTRALLSAETESEGLSTAYTESIAMAVITRIFAIGYGKGAAAKRPRVSPLAKWRLNRALDFIDRHLAEPILLADMAGVAGLTRMHFAAQFRIATGLRPREYLLRRRIERAQTLLADGDSPLVGVALSVGFQNQAHFSTVFRRFVGQTPGRWRQLNGRFAMPTSSTPTGV
jgi:AraC family transcriptional regulator